MRKLIWISAFLSASATANQEIYSDEQGCKIDDNHAFPLVILQAENSDNATLISALDLLATRNCDINAVTNYGLSALNIAIYKGNINLVEKLLALGAKPELKINAPDYDYHDLDSQQFVGFLQKDLAKNPDKNLENNYQKIAEILKNHRKNKTLK